MAQMNFNKQIIWLNQCFLHVIRDEKVWYIGSRF